MAMRYYAPFPGSGGDPARLRVPHALRIGDAERDAAATDLGEHYAAGRLSLDELHDRLDAVFAAKTLGQLTRVMADLPGPSRLHWPAGPHLMASPGLGDHWGPPAPTGFYYQGHLGPADGHWQLEGSGLLPDGYRSGEVPEPTPTDRAGRYAALSLLMLAMLIWLFTALLFARHGAYHGSGPMMPDSHHFHHGFGPPGPP